MMARNADISHINERRLRPIYGLFYLNLLFIN
jgi:hypothetical protein